MANVPNRVESLLSAALRHIRDAEHLVDAGHANASPDQAFHLAGFAPECARKALLGESSTELDKAIGHDFGAASDEIIETALSWDILAHRYDPLEWHLRYPTIATWDEQARYRHTGYRATEAAALVADARKTVDEVVYAMWADGRLARSFGW